MSYHYFSRDFLERTKKILEDYSNLFNGKIKKNKGYEITLLLNCMMGLLVFPNDYFFNELEGKDLNKTLNYLNDKKVTFDMKKKPKSFKYFVRGLRNSIVHMGDSRKKYKSMLKINGSDVSYNDDKKIGKVEKIEFVCINEENNNGFDFTITLDLSEGEQPLVNFLTYLCDVIAGKF